MATALEPAIAACIDNARVQFAEAAVDSLNDAFDENLDSVLLEQALADVPAGERDAMRAQLQEMLAGEQQRLSGHHDGS